jgi:hypothetical protein
VFSKKLSIGLWLVGAYETVSTQLASPLLYQRNGAIRKGPQKIYTPRKPAWDRAFMAQRLEGLGGRSSQKIFLKNCQSGKYLGTIKYVQHT